jgi:hypothetical protein
MLTTWHPLSAKVDTNFADKLRSLGWYSRSRTQVTEFYLREVGWSSIDCIQLAQDGDQWRALVNMLRNVWFHYSLGKFLSSRAAGYFSKRPQPHGVSVIHVRETNVIGQQFVADFPYFEEINGI